MKHEISSLIRLLQENMNSGCVVHVKLFSENIAEGGMDYEYLFVYE